MRLALLLVSSNRAMSIASCGAVPMGRFMLVSSSAELSARGTVFVSSPVIKHDVRARRRPPLSGDIVVGSGNSSSSDGGAIRVGGTHWV
jgi:hypothetical protein